MPKPFKSNEAGAFFAATVGLSVASWQVSFTLGAYGEVFYTSLLTIWIASVATLFASLVIGRTDEGETYVSWWGTPLLLTPTVSLTGIFWAEALPWLDQLLSWGVLLSLPYIAYVLLTVSAQEAMELRDRRLMVWLGAGFVAINALSYSAGVFNAAFMTCDDFTRAGDEAPASCWAPPGEAGAPASS